MSASILVVEDNADNMNLFRWVLEDEGYDITGVVSAEEGLSLLESNHFDLVLMDISLPGMNGKEAIRRLRSNPRFATLPIIAATAHAVKEEEDAIRASGVSTIVTKPIEEDHFLQTIREHLENSNHG